MATTAARTEILNISVEVTGPADGPPVLLLLHGWPNADHSERLAAARRPPGRASPRRPGRAVGRGSRRG